MCGAERTDGRCSRGTARRASRPSASSGIAATLGPSRRSGSAISAALRAESIAGSAEPGRRLHDRGCARGSGRHTTCRRSAAVPTTPTPIAPRPRRRTSGSRSRRSRTARALRRRRRAGSTASRRRDRRAPRGRSGRHRRTRCTAGRRRVNSSMPRDDVALGLARGGRHRLGRAPAYTARRDGCRHRAAGRPRARTATRWPRGSLHRLEDRTLGLGVQVLEVDRELLDRDRVDHPHLRERVHVEVRARLVEELPREGHRSESM